MSAALKLVRGFKGVSVKSSRLISSAIIPQRASKSFLLARSIPSITTAKNISEKTFAEEEAKQQSWLMWLFDPLVKSVNSKEKIVTQGEKDEREELLARVQACYYTKPPTEPDRVFFEEAFHLLIKYDDWRSVEALWRLGEVNQHEFDDALIDKVEDYLLEVRERRWYED